MFLVLLTALLVSDTNGAGIHAEACFEDQLIMSEEEVQLLLSKCSEGKVMITSKKFPNENRLVMRSC